MGGDGQGGRRGELAVGGGVTGLHAEGQPARRCECLDEGRSRGRVDGEGRVLFDRGGPTERNGGGRDAQRRARRRGENGERDGDGHGRVSGGRGYDLGGVIAGREVDGGRIDGQDAVADGVCGEPVAAREDVDGVCDPLGGGDGMVNGLP